jgi:hypothetical protein
VPDAITSAMTSAMSSAIGRILVRAAWRWPGAPPGPGKNLPFFRSAMPLLS